MKYRNTSFSVLSMAIHASVKNLFVFSLLLFISCSSAPKRPVEVFTTRNEAAGQIKLAEKTALQGQYKNAELYSDEAWRLAVLSDDLKTRVEVLLSQGLIKSLQSDYTKAAYYWNQALDETINVNLNQAGTTEKTDGELVKKLNACAKMYCAYGELLSSKQSEQNESSLIQAEKALSAAISSRNFVKDSFLYTAFSYQLEGFAQKELGKYKEASAAFLQAASIHSKNNYLEAAAFDWYAAASVYSKEKKYDEAINALNKALSFDRRSENAWGLAMDWNAIGIVQDKAGRKKESDAAFARSREILDANGVADGNTENKNN